MKVAIIGCGMMGGVHADCASGAGFDVAVCADPVLDVAKTLAETHGAEATDDCAGALVRDDIDIVAIASPTKTHMDFVVTAAKAGKQIFCEKPLARTLDQCNQMLAAVEEAGVKLFVGHVVRYFHEYEAMKAQIESGAVGKVGWVRTFRGGMCPHGRGEWFRSWDDSGGVTLDCIIHDFDWLRYCFGDVERVFSQDLRYRNLGFADYSMTTLRFKSGMMAQAVGSWAHPEGFRTKVEICGEGGLITHDSAEAPIEASMRETESGEKPSVIVPGSPVNESPYLREWMDFKGWLDGTSEPKVTAQDAVEAIRIGLAALESADTNQPVTL